MRKRLFVCMRVCLMCLTLSLAIDLHAQDRMKPARIEMLSSLRGYETDLINFFCVDDADFACLIKPSFSGEYCLSYSCRTRSLNLKCASKNIWYAQKWYESMRRHKNPNKRVSSTEYTLAISDSLATSLRDMITTAVLTSTYQQDDIDGLDGTWYKFIIHEKVAECWEPDKSTNCGQAVVLIGKLCDAVRAGNKEEAESLTDAFTGVTKLFRQFE